MGHTHTRMGDAFIVQLSSHIQLSVLQTCSLILNITWKHTTKFHSSFCQTFLFSDIHFERPSKPRNGYTYALSQYKRIQKSKRIYSRNNNVFLEVSMSPTSYLVYPPPLGFKQISSKKMFVEADLLSK